MSMMGKRVEVLVRDCETGEEVVYSRGLLETMTFNQDDPRERLSFTLIIPARVLNMALADYGALKLPEILP